MTDQLATDRRVDEEALAALAAGLRGAVLLPGAEGYDEARSIWNGLIDLSEMRGAIPRRGRFCAQGGATWGRRRPGAACRPG